MFLGKARLNPRYSYTPTQAFICLALGVMTLVVLNVAIYGGLLMGAVWLVCRMLGYPVHWPF